MSTNKIGSKRPGPVYDDAMKVLARDDLDAVLSLVGIHGMGARPMTSELPGSAMHADLIARTPDRIVHVEFVKDRDPNLDLPVPFDVVRDWARRANAGSQRKRPPNRTHADRQARHSAPHRASRAPRSSGRRSGSAN